MNILKKATLVLLFILAAGCKSPSTEQITRETSVPGADLLPVGRFDKSSKGLELISSGSHFAFSFSGTGCKVYCSLADWQTSAYIQYEVDGNYKERIKISKGSVQPISIKVSGSGKHTVQVYKATEAHSGPVYIEKITGNEVQAVQPPDVPLIEFIGNSITCGAFADASAAPCATGAYPDQYNAFYAYGPRVARALGTDFILSSVSGIGIYRNWDSDGPTMPQLYENTDFALNSYRKWKFNTYKPKIVSIALGTNDCNDGNGATARSPFNSDTFITKYIEFVKLVKSKYPLAKIILLNSPVVKAPKNIILQNCLNAVKVGIDQQFPVDAPVTVYFLKEMNPTGCSGHPGVADHGVIANELIPVFRDNLNK